MDNNTHYKKRTIFFLSCICVILILFSGSNEPITKIAINERYHTPGQALAPEPLIRLPFRGKPRGIKPYFPCAYSGMNKFTPLISLGNKKSISAPSNIDSPKPKHFRLTAVGDIMFHETQLWRGYSRKEKLFNFSHAFAYVKNYLSEGDLTIGNIETTLAGPMGALVYEKKTHYRGYQAFPTFNTPSILADNLKAAGFDVIQTSNNHLFDSGLTGVDKTLKELLRAGLIPSGTSLKAPVKPVEMEINGMSLSIISWCHGTNDLVVPKKNADRINTLYYGSPSRINLMLDEVRKADKKGTDWIIVTLHSGSEFKKEPDKRKQMDVINKLVSAGADIILGSHPHVLQPMEIRKRSTRNGRIEDVFIIYSLGNFLASQPWRDHWQWETDNSIILNLDLEKDSKGIKRIAGIEFIPIYTQWTKKEIRVIPVVSALSDKSKIYYLKSEEDNIRIPHALDYIPGQMMRYMTDYSLIQKGDRFIVVLPE